MITCSKNKWFWQFFFNIAGWTNAMSQASNEAPRKLLVTMCHFIELFFYFLQCIIDHQALPRLLNLLTQNHKKSIKKEACWTISNITAGNKDQIQVTYRKSYATSLFLHILSGWHQNSLVQLLCCKWVFQVVYLAHICWLEISNS